MFDMATHEILQQVVNLRLGELMLSAWRRTVHLWRPMAAWTVLVWATVGVILAPLFSALLGRHLLRGDPVRGNEELLAWLLTPVGLTYGLLAGALAMAAAALRYAGLFHIVVADLEGRSPAVWRVAIRLAREAPSLLRFCVVVAAAVLGVLALLAAGLGGIYATLLSDFDINYYLSVRPLEWWAAVCLASLWALAWTTGAAFLVGRTLLSLPGYLDGHRPGRLALRRAWERSTHGMVFLLAAVFGSIGAWLLIRAAVDAVYLGAATWVIDEVGAASLSPRPLVLLTGALITGSLALDAMVGFLGFSFVATVLTKCYVQETDLHTTAPPVPSLEELGARALDRMRPWLRPTRLTPLVAAAVLGSLALSGWLLERVPTMRPATVTAHRAGPPPAPENTLAALELSIQAGADFAEIDVQRTRDGVVVAVHDTDMMRTAGASLRLRETDYADLVSLVQGRESLFPAAERRVATLRDFLERARGRIGLVVELKYYGWDPDLAPSTIEEIRAAGMEDQVLLMSLNLAAVHEVRRLAPEMRVAYASALGVGDVSRLAVDVLAVARSRATRSLIRTAQREGMEVHVWTLNDARHMVAAIEQGADGIITDRPELAVRVNRELAELPAALRLLLRFQQVGVSGRNDADGRN